MGKPNDDINNMICLDMANAVSIVNNQKPVQKIRKLQVFPLMSWDLSGSHLGNIAKRQDSESLLKFSIQFGWQLDIHKLLFQYYEALVLTDLNQLILWTNDGFTKMTGYEAGYAIGKSPKFLQGQNTSGETLSKIKDKLLRKTPFSEVIINYRKDRSEYLCEIKIIPIHDIHNVVTHFIALEKAV